MDVTKLIEEMRREHAALSEAILSLERMAAGGKRRGRPPGWVKAAQEPALARKRAAPAKRARKKKTSRKKAA